MTKLRQAIVKIWDKKPHKLHERVTKTEKAFFHKWATYTGEESSTWAVVEMENGAIEEVETRDIVFTDTQEWVNPGDE